jgi:hypothetical protein
MQENILHIRTIQETNRLIIPLYVMGDMQQSRTTDIYQYVMNNEHGRIEIVAMEVTLNKENWLFDSLYKQPTFIQHYFKMYLLL